ncbi:MAG TPA: DNA primase DnaG [Patescibacteria group bacterium]|nr:DNA primase DnaG [Patescibacteria group bacterium]
MAKISPVSIKYMIHANFDAEGTLEKPDVIGAIFGQTEGLLGNELEMRELQKEGKIGRIEVDLHKEGKRTIGKIQIPTALDQSETSLIAAAIETIERMGPSDAQIEVEQIEDVRGNKRDYIIERAKKLMQGINGTTDSREISKNIKESVKTGELVEYGAEKLSSGDISGNEVIVVEGRADVLNLIRNGVSNVIAMNGTKLPEAIKELGKEKELTLFVDGDRGGKLIVQNVSDNANIAYVAVAPDGKEVEELTGKEILMCLRKKTPVREFLSRNSGRDYRIERTYSERREPEKKEEKNIEIDRKKLEEIANGNEGTGKAVLLDNSLKEIKNVSVKLLSGSLNRMREKPSVIIIDGSATIPIIRAAEDANVKVISAKNFGTTDTKIQLMSF